MSETFKMSEYNILYNFEKANELVRFQNQTAFLYLQNWFFFKISKDFVQVNGQFLHISSKLPSFLKKFSKIFQGYRKNFRDDQKLTDEIVKTFNNETAINGEYDLMFWCHFIRAIFNLKKHSILTQTPVWNLFSVFSPYF